jgi:signal transduction histidine kinase/FixJ family two-component response regulator
MTTDKCILVVDDEADLRDILQIYLEELGYEVETAADGRSGFAQFRRWRPPIVMTDIKMPGMDGIELLQRIKEDSPETEVIMITGHGDMDLAIKSLKLEATDFITKPINEDVLGIALKRSHERIDMRRQLRQYTENLEALVIEKSAQVVELERLTALGQAVDCLSSAFLDIAGDVQSGMEFFNEVPCFVALHDRDLQVVSCNQLYKERLGDKVGQPSDAVLQGPFASPQDSPVGKTFEQEAPQRCREILRYDDGKTYPAMVQTAPIRNSRGDVELVLEIIADISEVTRLQAELRTTQQRYHQLFEAVPCYIVVLDRDYLITAANRLFREAFGDDAGPTCHQAYKQQSGPCQDCPVARTFQDGVSHHKEMVVNSKSGEQLNVLVWTAPIRNAAGDITQVMEMATNVTQMRQLQDHLSSLGLMVSSVSHGVKGVLTGMDAGLYLLKAGLQKDDKGQVAEGFDIMKLMTERIRSLVLDVLHYAKERPLAFETIDAHSFVSDVAFIVAPKAQKHQIALQCRFEDRLGCFEADPVAMRSAIVNVLENAVEACLEDQEGDSHRIVFRARGDTHHLELEIQDDGIGMDAETRKHLFNLFFSSKGRQGTGLGLFIARKTIEQHGGRIGVVSEPGQGACFSIVLPRSPGKSHDPEMSDAATAETNP